MSTTCERPSAVEDEDWYYAYMAFFMAAYIAIFALCGYVIVNELKRKKEKALANNRMQVMVCLVFGACFRAASIYDFPDRLEAVEEALRVLKDSFWVAAFLLIIIYWVELRRFAFKQTSSVDKLRSSLYGLICFFVCVRTAQGFFRVFDLTVPLYICYAIVVSFLASLFVTSLVYGSSLLSKIRALNATKNAQKLRRLTLFIVIETVSSALFFIAWGVRTVIFGNVKCQDDPEDDNWCTCDPLAWFLLKLMEKFFEVFLLGVLCVLMVAPKEKSRGKLRTGLSAHSAHSTSSRTLDSRPSAVQMSSRNPVFGASDSTGSSGSDKLPLVEAKAESRV